MPVYEATQSSIHVLVTHAFLRSLATLNLAESRVAHAGDAPGAARHPSRSNPGTPPPLSRSERR